VDAPNPSDRGPVSTTGEEFDPEIFDDDFTIDDIFEWTPINNVDTSECGGRFDDCF